MPDSRVEAAARRLGDHAISIPCTTITISSKHVIKTGKNGCTNNEFRFLSMVDEDIVVSVIIEVPPHTHTKKNLHKESRVL